MSNNTKPEKKTGKPHRQRRVFSAKTKCEAILSVWAERRKPSEVCKELGIQWTSLNHWQDQALQAMMLTLEPRTQSEEQRSPALGPKLEKLLEKTHQRMGRLSKLEKRLEKIQSNTEIPAT